LSDGELAEAELNDPLVGDPDPDDPRADLAWPPTPEKVVVVEPSEPEEGDGGGISRHSKQWHEWRAAVQARDRATAEALPFWDFVPEGADVDVVLKVKPAVALVEEERVVPDGASLAYDPCPGASDEVANYVFRSQSAQVESARHELEKIVTDYVKNRTDESGAVQRLHPDARVRFDDHWDRFTGQGVPLSTKEVKRLSGLGFEVFIDHMAGSAFKDAWIMARDFLPYLPLSDGTLRPNRDSIRKRIENASLCLYYEAIAAGVTDGSLHELRRIPVVQWVEAVDEGRWETAVDVACRYRLTQARVRYAAEGYYHQLIADGRGHEARGFVHQFPFLQE